RPPSTRLQAITECPTSDPDCDRPAGRILSLSDIFFDPGDQGEIDSVYRDLLPESARYDYTIAIKQKEILAPDLSMQYGLQSVDGFDGGVLPLANYAKLMDLILPEDKVAVDGRLREYLESVPEARWMDLFNAKYVITDKVGDEWREGVFFDRQHQVVLDFDSPTINAGFLPEFLSTELWLISNAGTGAIDITFVDGEQERLVPERIGEDLYRVKWSSPSVAAALTLLACEFAQDEPSRCDGQWLIEAATLVHKQEGVFMPIILGDYRLIHSGDVKIYENLDVFPRAFLVNQWSEQRDVGSSVDVMADPLFDPEKSAVVIGLADGSTKNEGRGAVEVFDYEQESVGLSVASEGGGLLVMTDAYYPGWRATVDGEQSTIYQTDGYFRGVMVPPGQHIVEFRYEPGSLVVGAAMTAFGIFFLLILLVVGLMNRKVSAIETPNLAG
ncbi:MAG: YfhO family protein, partial [Candidatus Promineifilaceae bacterium]